MLRHLSLAIALRAVGVRRVQLLGSRGLQLQLGYVSVDHHELLLVEQYAVGQTQPRSRLLARPSKGPRLRIAAGSTSKASDPSAQRR